MPDSEELFNNNINLAYKFAKRYYNKYGFEDAIQISLLGFWKACLTYNKNKGISLGTYSYIVMQNEFNMLARSEKKCPSYISIEENITDDLKISDVIRSETNFEDDVLDKMEKDYIIKLLYDAIPNVEESHREICKLYLKGYKQQKIASILGISQAQVSRVIKKLFNKIANDFRDKENE